MTNEMSALETLGLTKEQLQAQVVDRLVERLEDIDYKLESTITARVDEAISEAVEKLGSDEINKRIENIVESTMFTPTNRWGEKQGKPESWREMLVRRAENFMREKVDSEGLSSEDRKRTGRTGYNNRFDTTRAGWMIYKYMSIEMERVAKKMFEEANKQLAEGLREAVRIKMDEIVSKLTVSVKK